MFENMDDKLKCQHPSNTTLLLVNVPSKLINKHMMLATMMATFLIKKLPHKTFKLVGTPINHRHFC